jgi:hypothetical protein
MRFDSPLTSAAQPFSLAGFAPLGFVNESLPLEEFLFARRKYKRRTAIRTFQVSVSEIQVELQSRE